MGIKYPGLLMVFLLPALLSGASAEIYVENATVFDFSLNTTSSGLNGSMDGVQPRIFTEHIDSILGPSLTTPSLELNNSLITVRPRIFTEHIDSILGPILTTPSLELNNSLNTVRPRIFTEHVDSILVPSLTTPSLELNNSLNTVRPRIFTEHIDSILGPILTTPSLELNNSLNTVRPRIFTEHIDSIFIRQLNVTSPELDNSISKVKPRIFIESADMLWFKPLINMTPDPTIPDSVTDLHETDAGTTWINWTWDNPNNSDFGHVIISINGTWKANTSANYFQATGLNLDTTYEIAIKTADIWGNVNESSVTDSARTLGYTTDITPPASIENPHASSFGTTWINWTWTNPSDFDFNHTMIYLDGNFVDNFSITYYNATDLLPGGTHTISTHTVDTSGNINQTWTNDTALAAGDLSNGLNIEVYKPENFSVYPVGETIRFDIDVTDSAGNPVDSGTSAYAGISGLNDASRQIILTKNGTNFTGEYIVQKDDPRGMWLANITAYNTTNSGRVSAKLFIIGSYIIQPTASSRSYVLGETASFSARVVKLGNPSQILTDNNLSLNMTVYRFNSSTPVREPSEMLFNDTAGLFYDELDTNLLGSGLFTIVFDGKDASGNVENASMMIGVSEDFSITIGMDRVYYDRGEPVNIFGTVRYDNNSPISNANISIQLNLQGYKRSYSVITNETGSYNYTFRPFAAEAGNYSIKATVSNIGLQRNANSDFTIYGLYLAPESAIVNIVEDSTQKINFTLYNLGDTKLTGINPVIKDLDNSDTVTATINPADIPSELLPYNSTSITVQINAGTPVPDNAVFQLEVTTEQNSNETSGLNVNLFSPTPIVKVYPENIQIGLNKNQTVIKTVTIANIGYGSLKNITLHQLNNNWSRITSNTSLGDLKPGENASFDVHINSYNVDLGTYYDTVNITSDNYEDVKVNLTAYVTDLYNGSLLFHVRNALEKELQDANISLINQETYEEFGITTNSSGYALLNNLPTGRYIFEVSSDGTNTLPQMGVVEVEAMEIPKLIEISLYMSYIDFDWEVIPTSIEDYYNVILRMRFETDVPIPLLLAFPPNIEYNMAPGEEKTGTFTLYNVGLVSIYNVTISQINYNGIILDPMITDISEIKGKSNIQIPYKIKLASNAASCQELSGKINIRGRYLHFINNHEVISYIGTTIPVLVRTPFNDSCSIQIPIPNFCFNIDGLKLGTQTENLSVDPSTIWFITGGESFPIDDNNLLLEDVSIATNHNQQGDIKLSKAWGMTFSFGVEDAISYLIPGASLSFDVIGNGANIPYFNGIWSGFFNPDIIVPEQNANLTIERQTSGVGLTLPELIGGGIGFQFGNTTCYNCIWILPIGGVDLSTPHLELPNITIYTPQVHLVDGGFCWNCFPDVFIVPTLPHFGGTTHVPWDWPEWIWNVPTSDPFRQIPKPKVTQTIHEVVELSISQNVTMERDAFWAGLGIRNRMPDKNINNVRVDLQIKGNGGSANDKFFIQAPRLNGINNIAGSGVISSSSLAKAQWLMIPKPGAGGVNPDGTKYNISANISYSVDGVNFEISTQEVEILVKPQPEVVLDYFIPSDVIANKPFKLAVKVTNEGYGPARNFSIETAQPVIYYNPSGLLIDFEIIRSQLQGQERSTSLKIDFGNIEPAESKLAWWDMVTSIDGTFTEFTGEYTHTSELGGMETSLIKKINTYIIQKQMGNGEIGFDFLANSKSDENHYILFNSSNGNSTFVNRANYTVVNMPTPENPVLDVSMEDYTGQWVIVSIENPYNDDVPIEKVFRTRDGTEIPSYNYWIRNGRILIVDHYEEGFDGKYSINYIQNPPEPNPNEPLMQLKSNGITRLNVGEITNERTVIFRAYVNDSNGSKLKLQVELRRLDEYGGNFNETVGGFKESDFVDSGAIATASAIELIDGNYHWRARTVDENENKSEWISFGGNPDSSTDFIVDTTQFKFVQLTDVHIGYYPSYYPVEANSEKYMKISVGNFTDTLQAIKSKNPDFLLITGDLVEYDNKDFFIAFENLLRSINIPVKTTPGNHDRRNVLSGDNLSNYNTYIKSISNPSSIDNNYSFDFNGYRFIGLDSGADYSASIVNGQKSEITPSFCSGCDLFIYDGTPESGGLSDEQMRRLKGEFNNTAPKIVFMHHPVMNFVDDYSPIGQEVLPDGAPGGNDGSISKNRLDFMNYARDSNVQLVLTGHSHNDPIFNISGNSVSNKSINRPLFIQTRSATNDDLSGHGYRVIQVKDGIATPHNSISTPRLNRITVDLSSNSDSFWHHELHAFNVYGKHTGMRCGEFELQIPQSYYTGDYSGSSVPQVIVSYTVAEIKEYRIYPPLSYSPAPCPESGGGGGGGAASFSQAASATTLADENWSNGYNFTIEQQSENSSVEIRYENINLTNESIAAVETERILDMNIDYNGDNITDAIIKAGSIITTPNQPQNNISIQMINGQFANLYLSAGNFPYAGSINEGSLSEQGKPNYDFIYGLFSFGISGLTNGSNVNVIITLPQNLSISAQYWKYGATLDNNVSHWYQIPIGSNDGDNVITIQLQDGGIGDDDGIANGIIVDAGGPSIPTNANPIASVENLQATTGTTWLNFTWLNPSDLDFSHTELYLNGTFLTNVMAPQNYYYITGLIPDTEYELGTHTVDTGGNINQTWVNRTARTVSEEIHVTNPSANPGIILNDNGRARPPGRNITHLNVTVTGNVASVTIDLSPIGGSATSPMIKISGTEIYTLTTNATSGINLTNNLVVNATDTSGNFNNSVGIPLTVMLRGDIVRDNKIDLKDLLYLRRYLAGLEPSINMLVADIQPAFGDDYADLKDLLFLRRHLAGLEPVI